MRVLLDTNVILDLMLEREPWRAEAAAIAEAGADGRLYAHACASSITDIFYVSRKLVGADKARRIVRECLDNLHVVSVTRELLDAAERRVGKDFEDNLQIECTTDARLDAIVTRNPKDLERSSVRVLSPAKLLALLPKLPASKPEQPK
jgi:predicted nucleic acid-binding protein